MPTGAIRRTALLFLALAFVLLPAQAQDIRGLEVCTAEKQMERRTSCLQSNVELLQQTLAKLTRETNDRLGAAARELAAAKGEIAALRTALGKLEGELAQLRTRLPAETKKQP
jgi:septal ring factor EnvC (AmiA/AmiB activator)